MNRFLWTCFENNSSFVWNMDWLLLCLMNLSQKIMNPIVQICSWINPNSCNRILWGSKSKLGRPIGDFGPNGVAYVLSLLGIMLLLCFFSSYLFFCFSFFFFYFEIEIESVGAVLFFFNYFVYLVMRVIKLKLVKGHTAHTHTHAHFWISFLFCYCI